MTYRLTVKDNCSSCNGDGGTYSLKTDSWTKCGNCGGSGGREDEREMVGDEIIEHLLDRIETFEERVSELNAKVALDAVFGGNYE